LTHGRPDWLLHYRPKPRTNIFLKFRRIAGDVDHFEVRESPPRYAGESEAMEAWQLNIGQE